jgi:hypothetical protein
MSTQESESNSRAKTLRPKPKISEPNKLTGETLSFYQAKPPALTDDRRTEQENL